MPNPAELAGRLVARILMGSWRAPPPPLELEAADLSSITPHLLAAGVAGLAWRRVRDSDLRNTDSAAELRRQYEGNTIQAVLHRQRIESLLQALRSAAVEPVLVKGWAAARLYSNEGLRPYADVDVCVERRQLAAAQRALKTLSNIGLAVDLHCEFETLGGGDWKEIYSRAQIIHLGETDVHVPSPEDHLRILSIHMLREGAWRPVWLCDVAAAVESRPAEFDWQMCFGHNRRWSNWTVCALKMAQELLGAEISGTPAEDAKPLRRLLPPVLREWGSPSPSMAQRHRAPMARHLRSPATVWSGFRHRWPNPIEGTVVMGGSFNELPRLPFQLGAYLMRGAGFALGLPTLRRER